MNLTPSPLFPFLLPFKAPCVEGIFIERHKRFSILARIDDKEVWLHTNNSGSMQGLLTPGNKLVASYSNNPKRKTAYTLELMQVNGVWVGVNTLTPNRLLEFAFEAKQLEFAKGYTCLSREQNLPEELRFAGEKSRLDGLLTGPNKPPAWVECKNVTLVKEGVAYFPDAKTERGQKHLRSLIHLVQQGARAVCLFLVQREDAHSFAPAEFIDPKYAELFWQALEAGVEVYAYKAMVSVEGIGLGEILPVKEP